MVCGEEGGAGGGLGEIFIFACEEDDEEDSTSVGTRTGAESSEWMSISRRPGPGLVFSEDSRVFMRFLAETVVSGVPGCERERSDGLPLALLLFVLLLSVLVLLLLGIIGGSERRLCGLC